MRPSSRGRWRLLILLAASAAGCLAPADPGPARPDAPQAARPRVAAPGPRTAAPAPLRFRHLTIEDGLAQNAVYGLLQDRAGFVWVGTKDGLNRYDGAAFVAFRHDPLDPATLSSNYVAALLESRSGALWVGTHDGGLNRLDPATGAAVRFAQSPRRRYSGLAEDAQGDLWMAVDGEGVYRLPAAATAAADAAFEALRHDPADPGSLPSNLVTSVLAAADGTLWVGTANGLYRRGTDGRGTRFGPAEGLLDPWASALAETPDGTLWVGSPFGLSRRDARTGRFTGVRYPRQRRGAVWAPSQEILDDGGRLWLATSDGLAHFDPATGTYAWARHDADEPESLSSNGLTRLLRDRSGVLWVGSNGFGLSLHDPKAARFTTFRYRPPASSRQSGFSVRALHEDAAGGLWIGADVLYHRDAAGTLRSFEAYPARADAFGNTSVFAITGDRAGALWFATSTGLFRHDPATGQTRRYAHDASRPDGLPDHMVLDVFEDRRGALWAVTRHHLARLDDPATGRFTSLRHTAEVRGDEYGPFYPSLYEDAAGHFWMGARVGLLRLDPRTGARRLYRTDPDDPTSLSDDHVRAILPDPRTPERVLWIATAGGGLNRLDVAAGTFANVTTRDGLPNDVVYSVLPDRAGRLWLSTNRGLARYDPRSGAVQTYDVHDGLQSNEFNSGAWHQTPDGRIVVGGLYGVTSFDPETFADNLHAPPVVLTGLSVGGRPVDVGDRTGLLRRALWATDTLRLSHRESMVTFAFAALDFSAPTRNRHAYRLDGFDDDWIQAGTGRTATYTNLPPGRYAFRVRGTNNDGRWSEHEAALAVAVAPPPWRSAWAYLLYAALAVGALGAALRTRRERVALAHRMELERVEAEQLRALDRARSAFFANVSHEFRTPLTLTLGPLDDVLAGEYGPLPEAVRAPVGLARRSAARVLGLIGQILDTARLAAGGTTLRAQPLDLAAVARAHLDAFAPLAAHRRIAAEFGAEPTAGLWADPEHVGTILTNLLSNAFKFTPEGGRVQVGVEASDGEARAWVEDTGPGIPAADLARVFERFHQVEAGAHRPIGTGIGLALAHDLAALHGGRLAAANVPGGGCRFTLALPLGTAHLAPEQIAPESAAPEIRHPLVEDAPARVAPREGPGDEDDRTAVLVADDNADIRAYLRRHLEAAGYRVDEAADGADALAQARARLPDLVVSDVMMPGLDGLGLCRALRADPETDFVPVLLLTARADPEDRLDGLAELCDDYLTKPFDARELVARVGNLIALRRRLRDRYAAVRLGPPDAPDGAGGDGAGGDGERAAAVLESADARFLAAVRAAVEARLGDEYFGVDALAADVGLSRGHLHRRLTALGQPTPSDFLRMTRLDHAAWMLRARAGTVSEVAYAVGYRSVAHFSNAFLAYAGVRPSAVARANVACEPG